jgi:tellurium resistance protein TerD
MEDDLLKPIDIDLGDYEDEDSTASLSTPKDEGEAKHSSNPAPVNPAPSPDEFEAAVSAPPAGNPAPGNPAPSPDELEAAISPPSAIDPDTSNSELPSDAQEPTAEATEIAETDDEIRPIDVMAPSGSSSKFGSTAIDPLSIEPDVPLTDDEPDVDAVGNIINRLKLGEQINLTRRDPGLKRVLIGMGWDAKVFSDETTPDLDVSLFLLNKDEMTRDNEDFVFYNNMETCDGGVCHHGDNRTGAGDGDDENMSMTLSSIPFDVVKVQVVLSIYQGREKEQSFSDVENIFFRIVNADTTIELFRLELDKIVGAEESVAVKIGHFLREGPNWFFEAEAIAVPRGLDECATEYGIVVAELS